MYLKSAILLLWFAASYALLVFAATTWWQATLLALSLAFATAGIAFCIQHDANHDAFSRHGAINRVMGMSLDFLGASSYVWQWKHNVFHHTYTNLSGADSDLDVGPFARMSPAQPRYPIHRFQQFFMWALYGLFVLHWHLYEDPKQVAAAQISGNRFPRPRGWRLVEFVGGKALFASWVFVVPMLFHSWWVVLLYYAAISVVLSLVLTVIFQLAHCVEEASFPPLPSVTGESLGPWAVHQVHNTVDFARGNRLLTWYVGGLNFQIEHHLFPKICHVHYPRLSVIVQTACADFGLRYSAHEGLFGAMRSHWNWLRRMGRPIIPEPGSLATQLVFRPDQR